MSLENTENKAIKSIALLRKESKYEYVFKRFSNGLIDGYIHVGFEVGENVLQEGYVITHPVDKACNEPDVTEIEVMIDYNEVYHSVNDEDYDDYTLSDFEEKMIIEVIKEEFIF